MSELCIFVLPFRVKLEPLIQKPLSLTTGHTAGSDKNLMHYYNNNNNDRLTAFDPGQPG